MTEAFQGWLQLCTSFVSGATLRVGIVVKVIESGCAVDDWQMKKRRPAAGDDF